MIIYKATNKINGKSYIGQTRHSLEHRKRLHLSKARQGLDTHFYQAIRKYGEDNFEWDIICSAKDKQTLNELETFYITKYDSIKNGYNMVDGGDNNIMDVESVKNRHDEVMRSVEVRKKISDKMKQYRKEHPFTEGHRKKLSEKARGNHNFGNSDTRSIPCYCLDKHLGRIDFNNYKEAGLWWFNTYHPFGETYSQSTYQRKIIDCIEKGTCRYSKKGYREVVITKDEIRWFRKSEVMPNEKVADS